MKNLTEIKRINAQIHNIFRYGKKHPLGAPYNNYGKKVYFDKLMELKEQKRELRLKK